MTLKDLDAFTARQLSAERSNIVMPSSTPDWHVFVRKLLSEVADLISGARSQCCFLRGSDPCVHRKRRRTEVAERNRRGVHVM